MTTSSDERLEDWRPVAPMDGCTYSGYQASDKGGFRSIDRKSGNRQLKGKVLATRRHDDGYRLVNLRCDSTDPEHNRVHTLAAHKVVLTTFAGECPPGMEARHSPRGPAFNWWPEGFEEGGWGTKRANHGDQVAAGTAVVPASFPCRNFIRCGGTVKNQGRRCRPCVEQVGQQAAWMLGLGANLQTVAQRFGYQSGDWVFKLAAERGYPGTKEQARAQHPRMLQRVKLAAYLRGVHDV